MAWILISRELPMRENREGRRIPVGGTADPPQQTDGTGFRHLKALSLSRENNNNNNKKKAWILPWWVCIFAQTRPSEVWASLLLRGVGLRSLMPVARTLGTAGWMGHLRPSVQSQHRMGTPSAVTKRPVVGS